METITRPALEWGVATMALAGQADSGDRHIVRPFPEGVLVAVVDGLGHGEEAAAAAELTVGMLDRYAHEDVIALLERCHERLRGTRGVTMSLASLKVPEGAMTWLGVGNVEGILLREAADATPRRESLLLRGGVVGHHLPPLRASTVPVRRGDTLFFVTDGIRSDFFEALGLSGTPQWLADRILDRYATGTDDALVLVARYAG